MTSASSMGDLCRLRRLRSLAPPFAIVAVGAHEHAPTAVVDDHLVEERIGRAAQRAGRVMAIALERVVLEVERHDRRVWWDRINALLAPGTEQLQRGAIVHLRIVELR